MTKTHFPSGEKRGDDWFVVSCVSNRACEPSAEAIQIWLVRFARGKSVFDTA